jgi:hypothetical protein
MLDFPDGGGAKAFSNWFVRQHVDRQLIESFRLVGVVGYPASDIVGVVRDAPAVCGDLSALKKPPDQAEQIRVYEPQLTNAPVHAQPAGPSRREVPLPPGRLAGWPAGRIVNESPESITEVEFRVKIEPDVERHPV